MNAYTNPAPNTYMLYVRFTMPINDKGVSAIAVQSSVFPIIAAIYAILIQVLFSGVWQLVSYVVIAFIPLKNRTQFVGLVAFWNANDPWTALFVMSTYLWKVSLSSGDRKNFGWGLIMFLPACVLAVSSVAIGVFYPSWLKLGEAAPVEPSAVFSPLIEEPGQSTVIRWNSLYLPSTLRAIGSAEAFDYHSRRNSVKIKYDNPPESNATHPQWPIDYNYHITSTDFGLQKPLDFAHNVTGSCYTEYGWIRPSEDGREGIHDEYWLWGNKSSSFLVPGPKYPGEAKLDFTAYLDPRNQYTERNISFSFIAFTADVGSTTPSHDPWYLTQPLNKNLSLNDEHGYRIKPGRPVLSCWQETLFCVGSRCGNAGLMEDIPVGIRLILVSTHTMPMIVNLALRAGVSSLKSYVGSAAGQVIDAASSTMLADMERLVLASFLSSREVFRDTVLMSRPPGLVNLLEDGEGKLYPGAKDFIIRTNDAVSVRFDLLLIAPVSCFLIWSVVVLVHFIKSGRAFEEHSAGENGAGETSTASNKKKNIFYRFMSLSSTLGSTQLYRILDQRAHAGHLWKGRFSLIPLPAGADILLPEAIIYSERRGPTINFTDSQLTGED